MVKIILFLLLLPAISGAEIAGTSPRKEIEKKVSFNTDSKKLQKIKREILIELTKVLNKKTKLNKILNEKYYLSNSNFEQFVFLDHYFDSKDLIVLKRNSAYRLRYRWKSLGLYQRYKIFPFVSNFYPIRVEVQFKEGYNLNEQGLMEVIESRFEFRKESYPFSVKKVKVPKKPWKYEKFSYFVKKGHFKRFKMLPSYRLEIKTGLNLKKDSVDRVLTVETIRNRIHVNIKNPWGSGPNLDHAFIISIDESQAKKEEKEVSFIEIEIEPDRNTSEKLNTQRGFSTSEREQAVNAFADKAKEGYGEDLILIQKIINKVLENNNIKILSPKNKYLRIMQSLEEVK